MQWVNELVLLRNSLSGSSSKQVLARTNNAKDREKKKCCSILVRPGLQLGAQTFYKFISDYPSGDEATETGCFHRSYEKRKPQGGTASRLYFETTWLLILFQTNQSISNPICIKQKSGSEVFLQMHFPATNIPRI